METREGKRTPGPEVYERRTGNATVRTCSSENGSRIDAIACGMLVTYSVPVAEALIEMLGLAVEDAKRRQASVTRATPEPSP